jgi:hypothetical protein
MMAGVDMNVKRILAEIATASVVLGALVSGAAAAAPGVLHDMINGKGAVSTSTTTSPGSNVLHDM